MRLAPALSVALLWVATLPAFAVELVMVEQPGCAYCRQWDAELSEIYPKTPEGQAAPLVRLPYGPAIVARYGAPYYTLSRAALHGALLAAALRRGVVVPHDPAARHVHQTDTGCTVAGAEMDAALTRV
mgnify:FL=1